MSETYKPTNMETHPDYNREPGVVIVPGSNYAKEMEKYEQFPGKYGLNPGNPYTYRPFPKMLYRAETYKGVAACMAAPPSADEYRNPGEYQQADESARRFTDRCQRIVQDESEESRAKEDGWRNDPKEAIEYLEARTREVSRAAAERNYADRNMGELAKREVEAVMTESGGEHLPVMPEKRRRGRPRKIVG